MALLVLEACGVASNGDPRPSAPPTSLPAAPPTTHVIEASAPSAWPHGFPIVSGGVPRDAPAMGPVHVAVLAYAERDLETTDRAYRDALGAAGWIVRDEAGDEGAHRFVAEHDRESVSVSIYPDGASTVVQTMQLDAAEER
jgi:hypothetical protein